ncbi:MAG: class I SAM-dependent methyltransferase [Rhodospirillales bacterium]|nr:class I SAM-dependent methyltransferase [Rhodospirillales bacterium]
MAGLDAQWARPDLIAAIDAATRAAGLDPDDLDADGLAAVEHLHSGGIATTRDQAAQVNGVSEITPETHVLDAGCGVGGPARWLARKFGCRVTGIDITPDFVEAARELTRRRGMENLVEISVGDATDLQFEDRTFDLLWCQNVTMNIEDKGTLLGGFHRVLKPGGRFTFAEFSYGPGAGEARDIHFPVNWARTPDVNFLNSEKGLRRNLAGNGFDVEVMENYSGTILRRVREATEKAGGKPPSPLGIQVVLGDDVPERSANTQRNLAEERLIYWMATARKV